MCVCVWVCVVLVCRDGQNHMYVRCTVFFAEKSPNKRSYTVHIY